MKISSTVAPATSLMPPPVSGLTAKTTTTAATISVMVPIARTPSELTMTVDELEAAGLTHGATIPLSATAVQKITEARDAKLQPIGLNMDKLHRQQREAEKAQNDHQAFLAQKEGENKKGP